MFIYTLSDVVGIFILVIVVLVYGISTLFTLIKQYLCSHNKGVRETRACDAICRECGKNLGFIGSYKERYKIK